MKIQAQVIAHSKNQFNDELITFVVTHNRWILAELNTHRMFSRNSASSRAIPFNKMVESVLNDPFIPIAWQKDHKGMQGTEYLSTTDEENWSEISVTKLSSHDSAIKGWLKARDEAVKHAISLNTIGVTKQFCNRLLEPFMWHTVIITTGKEGLENFFNLRCPKYDDLGRTTYKSRKDMMQYSHSNYGQMKDWTDLEWLQINKGQAEIHMMALAEAMYDAYNESTPELLKAGEWHIPYKKEIEELWDKTNLWCWDSEDYVPNIAYVSSVMCARVSFTVAGHDLTQWPLEKYLDKAIELANADPLHASPFEHAAPAMSEREYYSFVKGMYPTTIERDGTIVLRELYPNLSNEYICQDIFGWCRNYRGFIQLRHILEERIKKH